MKTYRASHMIKMDDLNHHKNLYAGRGIEWMVEASFIAAAAETDTDCCSKTVTNSSSTNRLSPVR